MALESAFKLSENVVLFCFVFVGLAVRFAARFAVSFALRFAVS